MLTIVNLSSAMGTVIKCVHCVHGSTANRPYTWRDGNGTVFYMGRSVESLTAFLNAHK